MSRKMKTIFKIGLSLLFLFAFVASNAQTKERLIRMGNRNYKGENYFEAEKDYKASLEKKYNYKALFNLGDAYYQQKNYEEASKSFQEIIDRNVPDDVQADAYYNLGNCQMEQQKYAEAFDSYKNCLKMNPDDEDARYNLEYARQKLMQQ
ncbi:MAG: DUF3808 domain-containing protein [Bacteroidales bacterium]|nr:DUF3808 domain-containing protein [Bacteroidales bacterium]